MPIYKPSSTSFWIIKNCYTNIINVFNCYRERYISYLILSNFDNTKSHFNYKFNNHFLTETK